MDLMDALYVCDTYNHCMRKIDTKGIVTTVAGKGGKKGYAGDGGLTEALLNEPYEVRFDEAGNMYFVEMMNHLIRRVDVRRGKISTIAGTGEKGFSGDGGLRRKARFNRPHTVYSLDRRGIYLSVISEIIGYGRSI